MAKKEKLLEQPSEEEQRLLSDVAAGKKTVVYLAGLKKKYRIGWLRRGAIRKITEIVEHSEDDKVSCKIAATIVLNGLWKIKFFYPLLWRWFYYIKQYNDYQLQPILLEGKKKVPVEAYYTATILAIGMKDTMMAMTKAEVERILQEHSTEQPMP